MKKCSITKQPFLGIGVSLFSLGYIFSLFYWIQKSFDIQSPWVNFVYFYGLGFFVYYFFVWILIRMGGIRLSRKGDQRWLILISVGLICICLLHALWIEHSITSLYKGM